MNSLTHHLTEAEAVSPMLRSMHSDADAQAHLTTFMQLPSLAQLYNSCKLWRRWLILPQQSAHRHVTRSINYTAESLPYMLRCDWLLQTVTEMSSEARDPRVRQLSDCVRRAGQQQFLRYLESLSRFPRLDSLRMHFDAGSLPQPPQLRSLLLPFAGQLRSLSLLPFTPECKAGLDAVCAHLPLFHRLESLRLFAAQERSSLMDLSALPALKRLRTFLFNTVYTEHVTAAQAVHFAQCRSLTSLSFGVWGPRGQMDTDNDAALATFVASRFASTPLAPVATLTDFSFLHSQLTAAGWDQLSRLSSLKTTLYLTLHDLSITKEAWTRLGQFTQLTELHVSSPDPLDDNFKSDSLALNTDHIWPSILQMQSLRELRVSRCNLHPHHITSLAELPDLELTVLNQCHLLLAALDLVASVSSPRRRIWLLQTSYGDKRAQARNSLFPANDALRR